MHSQAPSSAVQRRSKQSSSPLVIPFTPEYAPLAPITRLDGSRVHSIRFQGKESGTFFRVQKKVPGPESRWSRLQPAPPEGGTPAQKKRRAELVVRPSAFGAS